MEQRAIAVVVAGALAFAASCKDEPRVAEVKESPRLPPVEGFKDARTGSGRVGTGPGLPSATGTSDASGAGSGSGSGATGGTGTGTGSGSGSGPGSGSTIAVGSGSGSAATGPVPAASGTGSGSGSGSSAAAPVDCDVTVTMSDTRVEWSGGATGATAVAGGRFAASRLTEAVDKLDASSCRIMLVAGEAVRYDAVIAALEALVEGRDFRVSIMTPGGARLMATPPSAGAAGTAVVDAKPIVIGKREIRVGDQPAATVDDAEIATKVAAALAKLQGGSRGIMVIVKAESSTPYKVIGATLAGAKTAGFVSVIFSR